MQFTKGIFKQVLLAVSASFGYLTIGLIRGWSSTAIPSMEKLDSYLIQTEDNMSWVSAVPPLGAFIGSLSTGPLLHRLGRKKTLMLSGPLFVLGWVMLGASRQLYLLIIARVMTGFCAGIVTPSAQVYVSECAYPEIRGVLGSMPALFMALGVLVSYVLGTFLDWATLAFASALFPAAMTASLLLLPESPIWLRDNHRHKEADQVLEWLERSDKLPEDPEVFTTTTSGAPASADLTDQPSGRRISSVQRHSIGSAKSVVRGPYSIQALTQRSVMIPFGVVVAILVFQQISGIDTIIFYTVSIFSISNSSLDHYTATIIVGLVQVVATFLSLFLIDRTGRKPLLLVSGSLMGVSMATLGAYFQLKELDTELAAQYSIAPVVSLIMFMLAFSIGYCNIPFLLMGELLPLAQRSLMSSLAGAANLGSMFVIIKTYPDIKDFFGAHAVFYLYAFFCFLSCVFVLAFLPETKQKTLDEIEEYFEMKNRHKPGATNKTTSNRHVEKNRPKQNSTNMFVH